MDTADIRYDDGDRVVRLTPAVHAPRPTFFDSLRLGLEGRLGHPVDWAPFPAPTLQLQPGQTLVTWKVRVDSRLRQYD